MRIDPDLLAWSAGLSSEDRLRQAQAAFRLFHAIHRPYLEPYYCGFDSYEAFAAYNRSMEDLAR